MPRNTDFQPLETRPTRKHSGALVKLKNISSIIVPFSEGKIEFHSSFSFLLSLFFLDTDFTKIVIDSRFSITMRRQGTDH